MTEIHPKAAADFEPLLESLIQAAYDDGGNKREEFSERLKAARASVVAYVQRLSTAPRPAINHPEYIDDRDPSEDD